MKLLFQISTAFFLIIGLISCNRIKDKSEKVVESITTKTKKVFDEQSQKIVDKVFPRFDHHKADTENNKKRFTDFLKVEITPDVKNIYCFDDAIGIDADYMFAFNCSPSTSKKIIEVHKLTVDSENDDNGFGMQNDLDWWDKERIEKLQKYSWTNENQYFKYYWYDSENQKAYFFDFDM